MNFSPYSQRHSDLCKRRCAAAMTLIKTARFRYAIRNQKKKPAKGRLRGESHAQRLRHRSRPQRGEFPAADAAVVPGARRRGLSGPDRDHPRQARVDLSRIFRARDKACLRARQARHQARRYSRGGAAQCAGDAGSALRRRHGRRGAQLDQHAARRRHHRVYARPRRGQGADHRSRILQGGQRRARGLQGQAAGDRL